MIKLTYNTSSLDYGMCPCCKSSVDINKARNQNIGLLKAEIQDINFIQKYQDYLANPRNYLKFNLNSQLFITSLHHNFGKGQKIKPEKDQFQFVINKNDSQRYLQIEAFYHEQLRNDRKLAFNKQKIDDVVKHPAQNQQFNKKLFHCKLMTPENNKIGWMKVLMKFYPSDYEILIIKVLSATMRSNIFKKRRVYVRIQIGEQVFQSVSAKQTVKDIPEWSDAIHSFIIPSELTKGRIQIYQKSEIKNKASDNLLGCLVFNPQIILGEEGVQTYYESIKMNDQITGSIKLQFVKANQQLTQFPQIASPKKITINSYATFRKEVYSALSNKEDFSKKIGVDEPSTTILSDLKNPQNSFEIKIKKQEKSQMTIYNRSKLVPILKSIQSTPVQIKNNINDTLEFEPSHENLQIEENPQNALKINTSTIIQKYSQTNSDENISRIVILKTESVLIKNNNSSETEKQKAQFSKQKINNSKKNQKIKRPKIKIIDSQQQQLSLNLSEKQQYREDIDESDLLFSQTNKLIPQQYFSRKNNNFQQKLKQELSLKFKEIQQDLISKPLEFFQNSVVHIQLENGNQDFDFSLKQHSNKQEEYEDFDFQLVHLRKDSKHSKSVLTNSEKNQKYALDKQINKKQGEKQEEKSILNSYIGRKSKNQSSKQKQSQKIEQQEINRQDSQIQKKRKEQYQNSEINEINISRDSKN